jgi:hypothetical protein
LTDPTRFVFLLLSSFSMAAYRIAHLSLDSNILRLCSYMYTESDVAIGMQRFERNRAYEREIAEEHHDLQGTQDVVPTKSWKGKSTYLEVFSGSHLRRHATPSGKDFDRVRASPATKVMTESLVPNVKLSLWRIPSYYVRSVR